MDKFIEEYKMELEFLRKYKKSEKSVRGYIKSSALGMQKDLQDLFNENDVDMIQYEIESVITYNSALLQARADYLQELDNE